VARITIDRRDQRNAYAIVGGVHLTLQELAELLPEVVIPDRPDSKRSQYTRLDYLPGFGMHHLTKPDSSQDVGPLPWPAGDEALGRATELQGLVTALRASKGHQAEGARRLLGETRVVTAEPLRV
jgi:hypothetical protein